MAERQVKAAYLIKFTSYIEWPERVFSGADAVLKIGVVNANSLAYDLTQMALGRTVNGRKVVVRELRRGDSFSDINMLFIGRADGEELAGILAAVKDRPVLTVTESEEALSLGSMINFVIIEDKVRFEVAPKPQNIGISARLLAAAHRVVPGLP